MLLLLIPVAEAASGPEIPTHVTPGVLIQAVLFWTFMIVCLLYRLRERRAARAS